MFDYPILSELLKQLAFAIVAFAAAAISYWFRFYLKKLEMELEVRIGREQYGWLKSFISSSVSAVAQNPAFANYTGAQLKNWVMSQALEFSDNYNLPFGEAEIDAIIEEAVKWMKEYDAPVIEG